MHQQTPVATSSFESGVIFIGGGERKKDFPAISSNIASSGGRQSSLFYDRVSVAGKTDVERCIGSRYTFGCPTLWFDLSHPQDQILAHSKIRQQRVSAIKLCEVDSSGRLPIARVCRHFWEV